MNALFLSGIEQAIFDALPDVLKEGWTIEEETITYRDTKDHLQVRLALLRLHDPALKALHAKMQGASSPASIAEAIAAMNLKDVDEDDLAMLFFAVGPNMLSGVITALLLHANIDKDIETLAALTLIRHAILRSLQPQS